VLISRVFRLPDGGWVAQSDRVEPAPMGYSIPEPALEMVRLDAKGGVVEVAKPEVWSDQEVLGCSAWAVQGSTLVVLTWSRIDNESPNSSHYAIAEGLVEVPVTELPFLAQAEAALAP